MEDARPRREVGHVTNRSHHSIRYPPPGGSSEKSRLISNVFNTGEKAMTGPAITELDERIALIRQNISELVEQAAAYSGAEDEARTADRSAVQEQELARLIGLRDALLRR